MILLPPDRGLHFPEVPTYQEETGPLRHPLDRFASPDAEEVRGLEAL